MPGLLGDVLPWVYSRGNALQRQLGGLLSDPVGSVQQTAGLLQDYRQEDQRLNKLAFSNQQSPFEVTNKNALAQLADRALLGPMSYAPAGMINASALRSQFPGVDFTLSQRGDGGTATLSKIVVPPSERGKGTGTAFMQALAKAADEDGATLALSPSSDFGGSKARLIDFYKRFGFVPNKGRTIDYEISESMYRQPTK